VPWNLCGAVVNNGFRNTDKGHLVTSLLAPLDLAAGTRLGPKVYRKQVLRKGTINYPLPDGTTRAVTFDDQYLTDLADAYNAGAYDVVPFQLATPRNEHNEDPRNYGGRVLGAEVTHDGLDVIVELADDTAALVERTGRKLGVSARIKENLTHVDGRSFPRAIRHVLGTLDGRIQGLRPWEPVTDLATDDREPVVDLSAYTYQGETRAMATLDTRNLTPEQVESLESYAAINGIDLSVVSPEDQPLPDPDENPDAGTGGEVGDGEDTTPDAAPAVDDPDNELEPVSDAEVDAILDAEVARILAGDTAEVELSTDDQDAEQLIALDLAAGMTDTATDEATVERRRRADAEYKLAAERYGAKGVPPYALELARPVLAWGDDTGDLDLASPVTGDPIDVRGIVTGLLDALTDTVDLSAERGHAHGDAATQDATTALADTWVTYLENN
jgi:hypothetical protein